MALKVPEKLQSARKPKAQLMRASLPSTAAMLTDLRTILLEQIHQHKLATVGEAPSVQSATVTAKLMQAAAALEASTSIEHEKVSNLMEDLSPEEVASLEAEARKLL